MLIAVTVISILAITALVWLANRFLPFAVCPICAGVFLTWTGLLITHFLGYQINLIVPALLMGGTVIGIAYQLAPLEAWPLTGLKRKFRGSSDALLLWKALFIPAGFAAAYSALLQLWSALILITVFLVLISTLFLSSNSRTDSREESIEEIENKMKDCC
ncbi:hypothetical protein A3C86_01325 [Candidatus Kaiserbacteria bacterium RIFCSPHIGHO2_02_FULL_49_16]|uniref:Uncharacterized protein n=2 Tax=Parcubacteria group TaxID=1794811 RepID=A0A0G1YQH2_9BACT|nr:MAG: hypothetical protein UY58_C0007G0004 [Candidatus Magasanikbacteria bacterium GW2011_GWA2_50_22]OGG59008.1 MAG: hypothetical protein A3C86_01325 [Candidatus Kaiserbacteria bacterium RIFCSPHIGHO2_02_FULL_49_16]